MNADEFLPNAEVVAAIEKDIAIYNQRRVAEHTALERREPVVMMSYAVGVVFLVYIAYRLFSHTGIWYMPPMMVGVLGLGCLPHVQKWARRDAQWTQQHFRDHIVPVMLGFVPNVRYSHGGHPRSFDRIPKALLPSHNKRSFDDLVTATLDGRRIELFEARLAQKGKHSETVVFQGVILCCRRPTVFPGLLVATRRTGELNRFFRDLFGNGGLGEITVNTHRLSDLYEFRTDNRGEARKLLSGGFADLLVAISKHWRSETPQIAVSRDDVFVLLPSTRDFFELPPIERSVTYRAHIEPMARQFASFLAIAREVGKLDAAPEEEAAEPSAPPPTVEEAPAPPPEAEPIIRLLDGGEPKRKD